MTAAGLAGAASGRRGSSPTGWVRPSMRVRSMRLSVLGATLVFAAMCLGFLITTPTLIGPDEPYHFDRIVAAAHGNWVPEPGSLFVSKGARGVERVFVETQMRRGSDSWASFVPSLRDTRPSLNQLGGNFRAVNRDVPNYMTQHPPLYYALMGSVMWLIPHADDLPGDALVFWLRLCSLLLLLPLPYFFGRAALALMGAGPVAAAAPFLPLLVPGLARGAATLNNDNLAILIGAAVVALSVQVLRGDRTARTAGLLALLCVAGSLTKGTILIALAIVPAAYLVQLVRQRRLPGRTPLLLLAGGAVLSSLWWIRNLVQYAHLIPAELAWGVQYPKATGEPRPASRPFDADLFFTTVWRTLPSRFWAALGLHEPPKLPAAMLWTLWLLLFATFVYSMVVLRRRRLDLLLVWLVPAVLLASIVHESYVANENYMAIAGIQGRYSYPAVVGLLIPFAVAGAALLRRKPWWNPALICAAGVLVSGWAIYVSVEYTWLVRGTRMTPAGWYSAFRTMAGFFPFPGAVAGLFVVLALAAAAAGLVCTVLAIRRTAEQARPAVPATQAS